MVREVASTFADLKVIFDGEGGSAATDVAIGLAAAFETNLTGIAVAYEPILPAYPMSAPVPTEFFVEARTAAVARCATAKAVFELSAKAAALKFESRLCELTPGGMPEDLVDACRLSDLVVVGQADPDSFTGFMTILIEALLFDAAVPTLVVPYAGVSRFVSDHAMIAWDGSTQAARAIRAALPMLSRAKRITVVRVVEPEKRDGRAEDGASVTRYLARHGLDGRVLQLDDTLRDGGATLLNAVSDQGADWLVMGAYGHNRMRQFLIGGVTRTILAAATVPVLMVH